MHQLGLVAIVASGLFVVSACGGSSKSGFTDPEGGNGSGGSSTSQAGSSSSDAGEGSAAGGDGSATGGSTGTAGKSAGGTGGSSVVPVTDPKVREGCDGWCAGVVEAACDDETLADCLLGCRAIANSPVCNASYGELFACAEGATFTCNDDGDAVPQGCEAEYVSTGVCLLSNPDETIAEPCQSFCGAAEAAECTNSDPAADCTYGCELTSSLIAACSADWKIFIECAADAEVTCNEAGDAVPAACGADYLRYIACVLDAGQ